VPLWADRLKFYFNNPAALAQAERRIRENYDPPKWRDTAAAVFARAEGLMIEG
jgi:hypothetical protein